jgi:hypothetical protein
VLWLTGSATCDQLLSLRLCHTPDFALTEETAFQPRWHYPADALPLYLLFELRGKSCRGFGISKAPANVVAVVFVALSG